MRLIIIALFSLSSINAFATNTSTGKVTIKSVIFYSKQEPTYPTHAGHVQIHFESVTWSNGGSCHPTSLVIRPEDTHLISSVLAAHMAGKQISIAADDNFKVNIECIARAIAL